jgi:hypothetical protein
MPIDPVILYGPNGQRISSRRFLNATQNGPNVESWPTLYEDINKSVPVMDRRFVVSANRKLAANVGFIRESIEGKAICVVGNSWMPIYQGADREWGAKAETWLRDEWLPNSEIRGGEYDWQTALYLESTNVDHSGDIGILLTYKGDPARPWPCYQLVPAHRIGFRSGLATGTVTGQECAGAKDYKGRKYEDGVIFGDYGDPIAYGLIGETSEQDKVVSAYSFMLLKEPMFLGQGRGFPLFLHAIREARTTMKASEYEEFACLVASAIALIETNETGDAPPTSTGDPNEQAVPGVEENGLKAQSMFGGLIRYFRAGSGAKLEAFTNSRPGPEWDRFQDRLIRASTAGTGWPYELTWKMEGLSGPAVRSVQSRARRTVLDRQTLLEKSARRKILFALAIAQKTGRIPASKDWMRWGFVMPPLLSIDDGRDATAKLNDYFAGISNLTEILAADGKELDSHLYQRAREIGRREQIRREVEEEMGIPIPPAEMARAVGSAANSAPAGAPDDGEPKKDKETPEEE